MGDRLRGRTALVTGASRGIGRAVAVSLADEGARVFGLARDREALEALEVETGVEPLPADLADDAAVWAAVDSLRDLLGRAPDILVNSAGAFGIAPCAEESVSDFDRLIRINLRGAFLVTRAVLPDFLERRRGLIVNVGSVAGRRAFPGNGAYAASKFGLRGLHEVLLEELAGSGVSATLIEPAATDTALWDALNPDSDENLPNRADMLRPEDVAEAVLFAATRPEGVTIPVIQIRKD